MSSIVAVEPSFMTFVLESSLMVLSLPDSVRVLLERSNFSTVPWSELAEDEEPLMPLEPVPELP